MTVACPYWSPAASPTCGHCALHRYGGTPSLGTCGFCLANNGAQSQGLGDTVAKVLHSVGVGRIKRGCGGCGKRQAALNKALPYKAKDT